MLKGSLPKGLRPSLVEVLFDYRPGEWYRPASVTSPPDLRAATQPALAAMLRLGEIAMKDVGLSEAQKKVVEKRIEEIKKLVQ